MKQLGQIVAAIEPGLVGTASRQRIGAVTLSGRATNSTAPRAG